MHVLWHFLSRQCSLAEDLILDYFETNYIGVIRLGIRRPPAFEHPLRSVYEMVINNLPRTHLQEMLANHTLASGSS